ncbi:transglutaminase-like domain-containing protein [Stieleria sp. ICT_E10.1]|uniref:transglutaminase-like domain-containing protein n=1 Tax=Stieleria sedimenti TaxID=2976331 RepID=UPI00217F85A8|nr:transglutaminase-like domain-containing protein [Stieleria sedimenti]MCS7468893.1 transglutaminase-like domain-containing protein [Stieleria sedimenti]
MTRVLNSPWLVCLFGGLCVTCLCVASGCGDLIPPRPPIGQPAAPTTEPEGSAASEVDAVATEDQPLQESFEGDWNACYVYRFGSQVVGVSEIKAAARIDSVQFAAATEAAYSRNERLIFRTGKASFVRRITLTSVESVDGALKSFQSEVHAGPISSTARGTRGPQKLAIELSSDSGQETLQLDWPAETRGLFALEQTLRRRVIETGETRRLPVLMPSLQSIGLIELHCTGDASVPMFDGTYQTLREVDVSTFRDGQQVDSLVVWIDEQGVIQKTLHLGLRLESFRTDRASADELFRRPDDRRVHFSVTGSLRADADPTEVAFVVSDPSRSTSEDDSGEFRPVDADGADVVLLPAVAGQSVKRSGDAVQVMVSTQAKTPTGFEADRSVAEPIDTAASTLLDIRHPSVTRMAGAIGELPIQELAEQLARLAQNDLSLIPQGELRPASAIIRSGQGGEMDHAVLIAALLRARQIPARVVFGLTRSEATGSSAENRVTMHLAAWVVASIEGRWISIDPMTSQINRADQLCLSRPAGDADLNVVLAQVFRRLGEINVEIRGASYGD